MKTFVCLQNDTGSVSIAGQDYYLSVGSEYKLPEENLMVISLVALGKLQEVKSEKQPTLNAK